MRTRTPRAPRVKVNIESDLIRASIKADSSHCMIAEAVRAAYPDARAVSVDIQTIRFTDRAKGLRYTYLTPRIAQVPLIQFDQGIFPEPFSFSLRNGQVTRSNPGRSPKLDRGERTESQVEALKKGRKSLAGLSKARLVKTRDGAKDDGTVPDRIGGKTPPVMTPFARRRAFGLRALR